MIFMVANGWFDRWFMISISNVRIIINRKSSEAGDDTTLSELEFDINRIPDEYSHNHSKNMGQLIFKLLNSFSDMKAKILMLGLDGAGKTTILYQMKLNEAVSSVPTVGFNVEEVNYKGLQFTVWDIGGQTKLRDLWHHYYSGSDAVIYVLDSADEERIALAKETLENVIGHQEMSSCPLLLFANKMDISNLRPAQIVEKMGLHLAKREWHMQPCCGLNGEGIVEGFEWLRKAVKNKPRK